MKKQVLLIIGIALFVIGLQDAIRLVVDSQNASIFGWVPGEVSLRIVLGIILAIDGAILAKYASKMKSTEGQ